MWVIGWREHPKLQLRSRQGFTLAELLVTMVIMIMASAVITQALTFSYKVYFARTGDTEAQLLCQTVSLLVQDDLTKKTFTSSATDYVAGGKLKQTSGVTLGNACYGYGGGASMERSVSVTVTPDTENKLYTVIVSVTNKGVVVATNQFTVWPVY